MKIIFLLMIIQLLDMSDNTYFTDSLYYEERNRLLNQVEELIDQFHSTDDIDEKIKIFNKLNNNIKKYNETNNKSVKLYERLNPEEKIVFQEERTNLNKRVDLFNEKWKKIKEELLKFTLDEYEKLIHQYNSTNELTKKIQIRNELNEKIKKQFTINDYISRQNIYKDRLELIRKTLSNIEEVIKNNTFDVDVEINGIIYLYYKGDILDKKTNEFIGTYDFETRVFEIYEEVEDENDDEEEEIASESEQEEEEIASESSDSDEDEEQVEIINEQLFEEDEQISSFILDHTEQYNIHMIHSLCEDVMESCIIINELLNKINN